MGTCVRASAATPLLRLPARRVPGTARRGHAARSSCASRSTAVLRHHHECAGRWCSARAASRTDATASSPLNVAPGSKQWPDLFPRWGRVASTSARSSSPRGSARSSSPSVALRARADPLRRLPDRQPLQDATAPRGAWPSTPIRATDSSNCRYRARRRAGPLARRARGALARPRGGRADDGQRRSARRRRSSRADRLAGLLHDLRRGASRS